MHVFHPQSGILHIDDTIDVIFGVLAFHPSIIGPGKFIHYQYSISIFYIFYYYLFNSIGLYHIPDAPIAFSTFVQDMLNDWNFTIICCAHKATTLCNANAHSAVQTLLEVSEVL
jgi:hypothetical protein